MPVRVPDGVPHGPEAAIAAKAVVTTGRPLRGAPLGAVYDMRAI